MILCYCLAAHCWVGLSRSLSSVFSSLESEKDKTLKGGHSLKAKLSFCTIVCIQWPHADCSISSLICGTCLCWKYHGVPFYNTRVSVSIELSSCQKGDFSPCQNFGEMSHANATIAASCCAVYFWPPQCVSLSIREDPWSSHTCASLPTASVLVPQWKWGFVSKTCPFWMILFVPSSESHWSSPHPA